MKWTKSQERVLIDDGNLLVSASAGSGKTTIMIQKALELLKKGENIDRFLIMTFTKASAAEMKEKLIKILYEEIRLTDNFHLKKQLELLNFSNICTIDSFCFSLYKKYFADIGLQPAFDNMDEKESKLLFVESVDEVLEDYLEKGDDEKFFLLLERYLRNRDAQPLKEAISQLSKFLDIQTEEEAFIKKSFDLLDMNIQKHPAVKLFIDHNIKNFRRYLDEAKNLLKLTQINIMPDRYIDIINYIITNINIIIKAKNLDAFVNAIKDADFSENMPRCKKDCEYKETADEIKEYKNSLNDYLKKLKIELEEYYYSGTFLKGSSNDIKKLIEVTLKVRQLYKEKKYKKKKFDFADLSKISLKILQVKKLREEVASMYDYIFVDEYQDTNYIQESIINSICKKDNLFIVGDPKQAIYQFRHAEPRIFIERYFKYKNNQEGTSEDLNENFRSDKRILDFVNLIFREVMDYEFGGIDYKNNAELAVVKDLEYPIVSDIPSVEVALYDKLQKEKKDFYDIYSVRDCPKQPERNNDEGHYIADKIQKLVGKEYIYDSALKEKRIIEYKDIAILMYKRNGDNIIKEFNRRNIPYSAPGFLSQRIYEIDLLVDYLRVIDNLQNDIPLSSVMQSPLYKFSQLEMLKIRKRHPKGFFWEAITKFAGDKGIEEKIKELLCDLEKYRKMAAYCDVYELMLRILSDGLDAYLLWQGEEITAQVNTFINSVKGHEYTANIAMFLDFYDKAYDNKLSIPSTADAVKMMTIHNSKGLEFPIVFVADAHSGYTHSFDSNKDLFLDNDFGIATKYFYEKDKVKTDTLLIKGFKLKSKYREKEELLRLMYVAFTRAKNHLFIVGENKECKHKYNDMQDNFVQWLNLAQIKNTEISHYYTPINQKPQKDIFEKDKAVIERCQLDLSSLDLIYKYSESAVTPAKYSVSSLKDSPQRDYEQKINYLSQEERIAKGVYLHKLLELIDFNLTKKSEINAEIDKFCESGLMDGHLIKNEDIDIVHKVLNSEIIEYARKHKYLKEKRFMLYAPLKEVVENSDINDKVLVQGAIDLIILGEKNVIVDFKVSQSDVTLIKQRYQKQLDLYKVAAEKLLKIKIDRKIIYVINRNFLLNL